MKVLFRAKTISFLLVSLGMGISAYLLWRYRVLSGLSHFEGADLCSVFFDQGCDEALISSNSSHLGLPLAGWGLVYYSAILTFLLLAEFLSESFALEANFGALLLSIAGLLVSLLLTWMMLKGSAPFCPFCGFTHLINLALVFSLWFQTDRTITQLYQALQSSAKYLLTGKSANPVMAKWKILGFIAPAFVAGIVYQWVLIEAPLPIDPHDHALDPEQIIADFEAKEEQDIPISGEDPVLGPPDAPARIVVFSDFQCPACQGFASELNGLVIKFAPRLQVVFKHFPLDRACNPIMQRDLHPEACSAAYAAEAARRQGRFWSFHDELYAADLHRGEGVFPAAAQAAGLDLERFAADRNDEVTKAKVHSDIETAIRLEVDGTPTVYLNLRRVSDTRPQALKVLIEHVLHPADH